MELKELFTAAESLNGIYLQVGYGQGEYIREILSFDKNKRSLFYDDFSNYHYGTAYDFALNNVKKHKIEIIKGNYAEIASKVDISTVAILNLNPPIEYFKNLLETIFPVLLDNVYIYIPEYSTGGVYSDVANEYFNKHNLFANQRENSYIIKVPPKLSVEGSKVGRDRIVID